MPKIKKWRSGLTFDYRLSVRAMLALGVIVISLITILVVAVFLRQNQLMGDAPKWVAHTHEVAEDIESLSNQAKDAALYQHLFWITHDPTFLKDYDDVTHQGDASIPLGDAEGMTFSRSILGNVAHLKLLVADNPHQQVRADELENVIEDLLAYLDGSIKSQMDGDAQAGSVENALHGKELLDRFRDIENVMLSEERDLLEARIAANRDRNWHIMQLVLAAVSFFYVGELFLSGMVLRQWKQAKYMEEQSCARASETDQANEKLRVAYEKLEILNTQIKESGQSKLRAVVDHAIDGIVTIDAQGVVENFNPAATKIFGYIPEEIVGNSFNMLMSESHQGHDHYIKDYHNMDEAAISGTSFREATGKRKDGTTFPLDISIVPFWLDGEEHFSGTLRDMTERKSAEADLLRHTRDLERSNQELDDFAYIASHDLKEPLRGLYNQASFLLEDYAGTIGEEGERRLRRLVQLAQRMEHLVNDLLYFSRLGRGEMAMQATDPNEVVWGVCQMMEGLLAERNVRVSIPARMPVAVCDKPHITEVFRNLITNAVKYNDKPKRLVEIGFLGSASAPHGIENNVFYVKDNGIGIAPEFQREVFRIFRRLAKNDNNEEGTGVGLTFVKKIVERHMGHIWLESIPGQGTTFYFNLHQETNRNDEHTGLESPKYSTG
jgi:PAS domain S-box-containing protein